MERRRKNGQRKREGSFTEHNNTWSKGDTMRDIAARQQPNPDRSLFVIPATTFTDHTGDYAKLFKLLYTLLEAGRQSLFVWLFVRKHTHDIFWLTTAKDKTDKNANSRELPLMGFIIIISDLFLPSTHLDQHLVIRSLLPKHHRSMDKCVYRFL